MRLSFLASNCETKEIERTLGQPIPKALYDQLPVGIRFMYRPVIPSNGPPTDTSKGRDNVPRCVARLWRSEFRLTDLDIVGQSATQFCRALYRGVRRFTTPCNDAEVPIIARIIKVIGNRASAELDRLKAIDVTEAKRAMIYRTFRALKQAAADMDADISRCRAGQASAAQ